MSKEIENIKKARNLLLDFIKDLNSEELNQIPRGVNNNIIWHVGHLLVAQQMFCYLRAGQKYFIEDRYLSLFKPGSKPDEFIDTPEVEKIQQWFISAIDQFENDYRNKLFSKYTPWQTRSGIEINSIDDAIAFLPFHEGYHTGYITLLKRLVKTQNNISTGGK